MAAIGIEGGKNENFCEDTGYGALFGETIPLAAGGLLTWQEIAPPESEAPADTEVVLQDQPGTTLIELRDEQPHVTKEQEELF